MRFQWTFLAGAAVLGAFSVAAQIPAPNPALAQFSGATRADSDPISRLPAPPDKCASIAAKTPAHAPGVPSRKPSAPSRLPFMRPTFAPLAKPVASAMAPPAPTPIAPPIPTLAPRFVGQNPIRVGLSTAGGAIAVYAPGGATLLDLKQRGPVIWLPPGTRFELRFGPSVTQKRLGKIYRGPLSVVTEGARFDGFQRVYFAVNGEAARLTSNGANPKWGRPYRGDFEVFPQQLGEPVKRRGPLALVNVLPLEWYLRGVVPWEMDATAPLEALKAQAICARTKTLDFVRTKRFAAGDFEVCDYDACQGYPGMENEKPATTQAVQSTSGLAIYHHNRPIDAVYSTNSGGITASAADAWPGGASIPYLQSVPDFAPDSPLGRLWQGGMNEAKWAQFCSGKFDSFASPNGASSQSFEAKNYRWKQFVSLAQANQALAGAGFGAVTNLEVLARAASGRIKSLRVSGFTGPLVATKTATSTSTSPVKMPAPLAVSPASAPLLVPSGAPKTLILQGDGKIRAMFSGRLGSTTALPSSLFTISPTTDASGKLNGWNLQGAGWGHGVGMCQRGAQNHAKAGWDARRILTWYYRGVEIR